MVNRANLDSLTNDSNVVLYYDIIDNLLENATTFSLLSQQINNLKLQINNDRRVVNKSSALVYCEVALKSSYFWMPQSIGVMVLAKVLLEIILELEENGGKSLNMMHWELYLEV